MFRFCGCSVVSLPVAVGSFCIVSVFYTDRLSAEKEVAPDASSKDDSKSNQAAIKRNWVERVEQVNEYSSDANNRVSKD